MQRTSDLLKGKAKQLWTILPEASVLDALKLMAEKEIGALIVVDKKDKVVGIITERDYARKIILKEKTSLETRVKDIMTPFDKMYTVKPDTSVEDCMVLMTGETHKACARFRRSQICWTHLHWRRCKINHLPKGHAD